MFNGIHSLAMQQWRDQINGIMPDLMQEPLMSKIRERLERMASGIRGIGPITIDETLMIILEEQSKLKRGF